jgi:hypothetical protein
MGDLTTTVTTMMKILIITIISQTHEENMYTQGQGVVQNAPVAAWRRPQ